MALKWYQSKKVQVAIVGALIAGGFAIIAAGGLEYLPPELGPQVTGYRIPGAIDAHLGSYGFKPEQGELKYDFFNTITGLDLDVSRNTVDVTQEQLKKFTGGANLKIAGGDVSLERNDTTTYTLVFVRIKNRESLRDSVRARIQRDADFLADISHKQARIILGTALVTDHRLGGTVAQAVSAQVKDRSLVFEGKDKRRFELRWSDNTIVAYQMARFCWDETGKLVGFQIDQKRRDNCTRGTSPRPKQRGI